MPPDRAERAPPPAGGAHGTQQRSAPRMPDPFAVGAAYRAAMQREMRIHAALGIPWVVSDGEQPYFVLLPGLPRIDVYPDDGRAPLTVPVREWKTWTIPAMIMWAR